MHFVSTVRKFVIIFLLVQFVPFLLIPRENYNVSWLICSFLFNFFLAPFECNFPHFLLFFVLSSPLICSGDVTDCIFHVIEKFSCYVI